MGSKEHLDRGHAPDIYEDETSTADGEAAWLKRRRDLLLRAIAEMEHHQDSPNLSQDLMPNVPELLGWAKDELSRIDMRIAHMDGRSH